ncbi:hypothetical protein AAFG13_17690 [Bradyrhizobium sp. B124]|uniref:hypothetical protein n=1 Tax=Bradyrhizobium sp. B124 TaxID=3140245 RepID=UPI003183C8A3
MAERLTRQGRQVIIIDREIPSLGSTVASTAMLLWAVRFSNSHSFTVSRRQSAAIAPVTRPLGDCGQGVWRRRRHDLHSRC